MHYTNHWDGLACTFATACSNMPTGLCPPFAYYTGGGGCSLRLPPITMLTAVAPKVTPTKMPINCPSVFFQLINYYTRNAS